MKIQDTLKAVETFHDAFGIPNNYAPTTALSINDIELRHRLMQEENDEYLTAARNGDLIEVADALGDQLYILCGTILKHGLQEKISEIFEEIQRSNMSKLDQNGKAIYREDGKIMKSELYFRPNIKEILIK
jgi:predicted HAD superfamily Cof-like phosphohydrolase